jgi:hypothetical protein
VKWSCRTGVCHSYECALIGRCGGPIIIISTPYARRGVVFETWAKHFGAKGDPKILIAQGPSRDFNPSLPQSVVDRALERDPVAANAEWLGQFRPC